MCGDRRPTRIGAPCYPAFIEAERTQRRDLLRTRELRQQHRGPSQARAATALEGFWSIVVGAAAEASVKAGKPVLINELLRDNGIEI